MAQNSCDSDLMSVEHVAGGSEGFVRFLENATLCFINWLTSTRTTRAQVLRIQALSAPTAVMRPFPPAYTYGIRTRRYLQKSTSPIFGNTLGLYLENRGAARGGT